MISPGHGALAQPFINGLNSLTLKFTLDTLNWCSQQSASENILIAGPP
jgi:hypothetical protein